MKTQTAIEEMKARHAAELARMELKTAILEQMPSVPHSPSIANESATLSAYSGNATISFSGPAYDPEKTYSPLAVALALEADGWQLLPACRAKYGQWRRCMAWGTVEELPEVRGRDELKDCEPALPVWMIPNQYTPCEIECWMKSPRGGIHKVSIDTPGVACLTARRIEHVGGWRFERGTARVVFPERLEALYDASGEAFASIRGRSAQVDTEHGISGRLTWQLDRDEQAAFSMPLSAILRAMGIA